MGSITQPPVQKFNKQKIEDNLQRNNPYFICLKTGHDAKNCFETKRCRHCDGKHHQSICARIDKPTDDQRRPNGNDISREMANEHAAVAMTTTAKSTIKGTVGLQTASCMQSMGQIQFLCVCFSTTEVNDCISPQV